MKQYLQGEEIQIKTKDYENEGGSKSGENVNGNWGDVQVLHKILLGEKNFSIVSSFDSRSNQRAKIRSGSSLEHILGEPDNVPLTEGGLT